ncbi:FMN-dependent oxidoreductase (nitrilotriacetate monooxygenase family) [Psychrobacillus insolitus]|uniref:FMN-dependent oxidoreductase (Nitrilotriacetate monooxygenase family) n=1 Tax=Psychrobacillus insolitus TaxID=1461 RepID=A0A2W7MI57_9BACI|nr:LLM class flavin-dependent oxidoreductase [Psychrobacillus insolitus]PZX07032.1 FMN-dependent oxidoreductase (nitrilotriacetate monooxygenase family) [Psychrobacillus insolitus]
MTKKQMKLGAFINLPGQHVASWRYPSTGSNRTFDLDYLIELAKTAERGKFDTIFFADVFGQTLAENSPSALKLDPVIILSALAAVTKNIGLTATLTTTYNEPFHVARKFSAIDHLSKGRAAWNVVTSANASESFLFGKEKHLEHATRYERAEEFVDVVKKLWFSIEDEALVIDKEKGQFLDLEKVHPVDHEGKWFKVQGTLDSASTPQGHPVIVQAGSSEAGKELAAKTAEVIFTAWQTLEDAQIFYRDVKGRLAKYGRQPDDLKIMPGVFITVGKTEKEALAKQKELNSYILPEVGLAYLSNFIGVDLTGYDVNAPLPNFGEMEDKTNPQIRTNIIRDIAARENLHTLREVYERIAGARGHREIVGTPEQIVDQLEEWFLNEGADGFNIMPPTFPEGFNDIVDLVIPELQRRGLFRTEYESNTLRGNLGLSVPVNPNKKQTQSVGK